MLRVLRNGPEKLIGGVLNIQESKSSEVLKESNGLDIVVGSHWIVIEVGPRI